MFFKAYDMRGTFGVDFDLETVLKVGRALPKVVKAADGARARWLVGRDGRTSGGAVAAALVAGLREAGAEVTDLGLATTPMVYFFTAEDGYDGSVMVTASHNPPGDNGLKVSSRDARPVGYADGLDRVERLVAADDAQAVVPPPLASGVDAQALARYLAWQRAHQPPVAGLRLAVDCSNGMAALFVREMFPDALVLNGEIDGRFPAHSPNPLQPAAREQLAAAVRANGCDAGVIFDGDADRAMFVDETGAFVQPDYLIPVVARATVRPGDGPAPKVVHDVRTSRGAIEAIRALGAEPVMVPVGHAFAKPVLRRLGAPCGGELAGHYYFGEFHGCDSGLLAATRILSEVARAKARSEGFSRMMAPIAGRYANSGERNFRVADKPAAIARVLAAAAAKLPPETGRSDLDGIRLEYAEGWVNVRSSNTEPYLRLVVEADAPARLADWLEILTAAIEGAGTCA